MKILTTAVQIAVKATGTHRRRRYGSSDFAISALEGGGVSGQHDAPAALPPENPVLLCRRLKFTSQKTH